MQPFSGFIGGRWKMTTTAGKDTFDTWHWGPGRMSIRSMSFGTLTSGKPWGTMTAYYWHPGQRQVRMLGVGSAFRGVSEGTMTFDGNKAEGVFDLCQTGGKREMGLRWTFDGKDKFHDALLEKGARGYEVLAEWDRHRVPVAGGNERAAPGSVLQFEAPSKFLSPLTTLLGKAWQSQAEPGVEAPKPVGDLSVRTSFEYVPYVDAIQGRVSTIAADGTLSHAMDLYLYHHTGKRVLRCLALADSDDGEGIVYEGDITPGDGGRWLRVDLTSQRASGVSTLEARVDFEEGGGVRLRAWRIEGGDRTLIVDQLHREAKKQPGGR